MTEPFRAAVVQMTSGIDVQANLQTASRWVEAAARDGAKLIALPELFSGLGEAEKMVAQAESIPGRTSNTMAALAARLGVLLLAGSMAERDPGTGQTFNTSLLFSAEGKLLARYRKIHLFDIELAGRVSFQESRWFAAGDEVVTVATELGRLGLATCYDLRFPELFRRLADEAADVILVPSAFTLATGRDHWEVLLRARAIENQVYVVAPNQYGRHTPLMISYGRSMLVDPWGTVLATCPDGEGMAEARIDPQHAARIRRQLPALAHRRLRAAAG